MRTNGPSHTASPSTRRKKPSWWQQGNINFPQLLVGVIDSLRRVPVGLCACRVFHAPSGKHRNKHWTLRGSFVRVVFWEGAVSLTEACVVKHAAAAIMWPLYCSLVS